MKRQPNLFILGAPKCGTTSLANWLSAHPEVFMSPYKEPHWFNSDHGHHAVNSWNEYLGLFSGAPDHATVLAEASVWYLYSECAVQEIMQFNPNSLFLVLVRNPIQMAPSLHNQMVFAGYENIKDFAKAWRVQPERQNGERIPPLCREPSYIQYGPACSIGTQLEEAYSVVGSDRLKVIFLDDLKSNPSATYSDVLSFLGVCSDAATDYSAKNPSKERKSFAINYVTKLSGRFKKRLGVSRSMGLLSAIERWNTRYRERPSLTAAEYDMLANYFENEIIKLERITARDLSGWRHYT